MLFADEESARFTIQTYVAKTISRQSAAIVLAAQGRLDAVIDALKLASHDVAALRSTQQLVLVDTATIASQFMRDGCVDCDVLDQVVRPAVTRSLDAFGRVCAYGELVSVLWHEHGLEAANAVERWWNQLISERPITLLCGYNADPFSDRTNVLLAALCQTHTHLIPAADHERYESAVLEGLRQVLGEQDCSDATVEVLAGHGPQQVQMPAGQAALLALNEIHPALGHRVRHVAAHHYREAGTASEPTVREPAG